MKSKNLNNAFGRVLARLRHERNWSQEHLSFESDLTRTYISLLERGKRSPTLNSISQLAAAMAINADEIVRLTLDDLDYHNAPPNPRPAA
jgi:transcriptional regulator with XRE-family HTH domain